MSFSFEFIARSRQHALKMLDEQSGCPEPVKAFIFVALANISDPKDGEVRLIKVSARGHLCTGKEWSPWSSAAIDVSPIAASPG